MNKILYTLSLLLIFSSGIKAQDIICPSVDCGNLNVNFNNAGEVVFCEGSTITLINESAAGFDFFIIEWGDGGIDTLYDYDDAQHQYDIPDSLVCETPQSSFSVNFTGIALCEDGNSCQSGSYTFGIRPAPLAIFSADEEICVNTDFSPNPQDCHGEDFFWDFGNGDTSIEEVPVYQYDTPGTYTITYTVSNDCGSDTAVRTIRVVGEPESGFNSGDVTICAGTILEFVDQSNAFSTAVWSLIPGGDENWCFTDTLMTLASDVIEVEFKQAGSYTLTQTASNVCGDDEMSITITVEEAPDVNLEAPNISCDELTITSSDLNFSLEGSYTEVDWQFTNGDIISATGEDFGQVTFTQDGSVMLTVSSECGELERSVDISVSQSVDIMVAPIPQYCSGSSPDTLSAAPGGGTWSGPGVVNDSIFDPSSIGVGDYTLTYSLNNAPCNNELEVIVTVVGSETVNVEDDVFCIDSESDTLSFNPGGGVWQGVGIIDSIAGVFDPAVAGVGTFSPEYIYVDANNCEVQISPTIEVEALPVVDLPDSILLCQTSEDIDLNDVSGIDANPSGGVLTWQGEGVISPNGTFNSESGMLSTGTYTIEVSYMLNRCQVTDSLLVVLVAEQPLVIDTEVPVCISQDTLQLNTNLAGGDWSGAGIDSDGLIDLSVAGGGTFTYTYSYATGTSCAQSGTIDIQIIDVGEDIMVGDAQEICEGPGTFMLANAAPENGTWNGTGIIDNTIGLIDLDSLTPGETYVYDYCVESDVAVGCSACAPRSFSYHPKPIAGFSLDGIPCIDFEFTLLPDQLGEDYEWDFGDATTSNEEMPTYAYTDSASYTITQIIITDEGCGDTSSQQVYITQPPTADFVVNDDEGCAPFELDVSNNSYGDSIMQRWVIDGDTITGEAPPVYVFDSLADDTVFPILLEVSNICGTITDVDSVLVRPYPRVNFGIEVDEGCSPFSTPISNITVGNPDEFTWLINGVFYSNDSIPVLPEFTTPDDSVSVYTLTLIATNECGADTLSKPITVYPPDVEAFIEMDTLEGCQPLTINPVSFSTPGSNLTWEVFGPSGEQVSGGTGTEPSFSLFDPGIHTIVLYAGRCGEDTDTAFVEVLPAPDLDYTHDNSVCAGDTLFIQNNSQGISESLWDFEDGTTSNAYSPFHFFDSAGVYTITYTAISNENACPATDSSKVTVLGLPQSAFSPPVDAACPPFEVAFDNETTGVGELNYEWNFGDGTNASMETNPTHTFENSGVYTVSLVAFDNAGCFSDTITGLITVHPEPTSAFVLEQDFYCLGYDTLAPISEALGAVSTCWLIDGVSYCETAPIVVPDTVGFFDIQQVVLNTFGCADTSLQTFEVLPSPIASFEALPTEVCVGEEISLQNNSAFGDSFLWDFDNGTGTTEQNPTVSYELAGAFEVALSVSSTNGCPDAQATQIVTVNPNPVAMFNIDRTFICGTPLEATFTNTSTGNLQNQWSFGDGGTSMALSPSYTYQMAGTYEVVLTVTTDFGCTDSDTQSIDVYGQPVADATVSQNLACSGTAVTLDAIPTDALYYEWYLMPSLQADTGLAVTYTLDQPGTYDVRLIAIYNDLCKDTLDMNNIISVFTKPSANFDFVADESSDVIGDVRFINLSENATDYTWLLGDGTTSTDFEPEHEYDINRAITVQLIASNTNNGQFLCLDSISLPIEPEWITSFEVPNAFSPDYGDPAVRQFGAVGSGVETYYLRVYSPFGQLVWSTDELDEGHPSGRWNGVYKGQPVVQGAYTWKAWVRYVNGVEEIQKGTVTVLR
jgi:PKD repeat protein